MSVRFLDRVSRAASMAWILTLGACGGAWSQPSTPPSGETAQTPDEPPGAFVISVADVGFHAPESVIHDAEADVYLVSNSSGRPGTEGEAGFISRLRPDGTVEHLAWIDGSAEGVTLHTPRGMAIIGDELYVADTGAVRVFDRRSGAPRRDIAIPESTFLKRLSVAPDQALYVSDSGVGARFQATGTDAIYRIGPDGKVSVLVADPGLHRPTGLAATEEGVFVVDWVMGTLRRIDREGDTTLVATLPANQLDGLVQDAEGAFLVSSWGGMAVYRVRADGRVDIVRGGLQAAAGIGYDRARARLLVPLFHHDRIQIHAL